MILLLRTLNINIKLYCLLDSLASIEKCVICHNPKQLVKGHRKINHWKIKPRSTL